jgi:hypothetical protein
MRVVVFVVYVGESVGSVGGGGTFTATPPLGAPNGYRFGSVLPVAGADEVVLPAVVVPAAVVVAEAAVVVAAVVVAAACLPAAPALPSATASQTAAPTTMAARPASKTRGRAYELKDMEFPLVGVCTEPEKDRHAALARRLGHHPSAPRASPRLELPDTR